eukprot:scaffold325_cov230-Pinguiococcus_pyrenoidosus.AAC.8
MLYMRRILRLWLTSLAVSAMRFVPRDFRGSSTGTRLLSTCTMRQQRRDPARTHLGANRCFPQRTERGAASSAMS